MTYYPLRGDWQTLREALEAHTVADLEGLAGAGGLGSPRRKDDRIAALCHALEGPNLSRMVDRLTPLQRAAVAMAVHSQNGRLSTAGFRLRHGVKPDFGKDTSYSGGLDHLTPLCLFIYGDRVPEDLRLRLRDLIPPPETPPVPTVPAPPEYVEARIPLYSATNRTANEVTRRLPVLIAERAGAAQKELVEVLRLADARAIALTPRIGEPTATAVRSIGRVLAGGGDFLALVAQPGLRGHDDKRVDLGPIRALAWPRLLVVGDLARARAGRLELTATGRHALTGPAIPSIRGLWTAYLGSDAIDEVMRISEVAGASSGRAALTSPADRRRAIAAALSDCPVGGWVAIDAFLDHVRISGRDFEVTRAPWALRLKSWDSHKYDLGSLSGTDCWRILQARVVMGVLMEYAATLGLVDIAYTSPVHARADISQLTSGEQISRYDGLQCIRLTALGAYCIGLRETPPEGAALAPATISVTPAGEIRPAGALGPADELVLGAWAEATGKGRWRLERTKILTAVADGRPAGEIRQFLERRSGGALPGSVVAFLEECAARAESVTPRGTARLFECRDAAVADAIAADPRTRRHCRRAGERLIVVPTESEPAFARALRAVGFGIRPA